VLKTFFGINLLNCVIICLYTFRVFVCVDARNNMCEINYPLSFRILWNICWGDEKSVKIKTKSYFKMPEDEKSDGVEGQK
jgi:hypothetical protein